MNTFMKVYSEELLRGVAEHPEHYHYGTDKVPEVVFKMADAISRGTYNNESLAFKATCKRLKIKNTYKAIAHFIANHE